MGIATGLTDASGSFNMAKSAFHDDVMVQLIKEDPDFAPVYLHQAFIEIDEDGGYEAFVLALRHVIEAKGGNDSGS